MWKVLRNQHQPHKPEISSREKCSRVFPQTLKKHRTNRIKVGTSAWGPKSSFIPPFSSGSGSMSLQESPIFVLKHRINPITEREIIVFVQLNYLV
jgi:hypothetical protein